MLASTAAGGAEALFALEMEGADEVTDEGGEEEEEEEDAVEDDEAERWG